MLYTHRHTHVCTFVVENWSDLEVICKHWTDAVKRTFVEIWHEGYGALFVIDTSKALLAPLSLHSVAIVMNTLRDFQNRVPLKCKVKLSKSTLISYQ